MIFLTGRSCNAWLVLAIRSQDWILCKLVYSLEVGVAANASQAVVMLLIWIIQCHMLCSSSTHCVCYGQQGHPIGFASSIYLDCLRCLRWIWLSATKPLFITGHQIWAQRVLKAHGLGKCGHSSALQPPSERGKRWFWYAGMSRQRS